jgi:hypothetical protein
MVLAVASRVTMMLLEGSSPLPSSSAGATCPTCASSTPDSGVRPRPGVADLPSPRAFVALWRVLSANLVWQPMSSRIRRDSELRAAQMELLLEGVAEILRGTNPRLIRAKLRAMLPPSEAQLTAA